MGIYYIQGLHRDYIPLSPFPSLRVYVGLILTILGQYSIYFDGLGTRTLPSGKQVVVIAPGDKDLRRRGESHAPDLGNGRRTVYTRILYITFAWKHTKNPW